jgi:hypothetical protein
MMRTIAASIVGLALILACQPPGSPPTGPYPVHHSITTTLFWIGETASVANCFRGNQESAWDDRWQEHYGGYDDPDNRNGWLPAGFVPKENPFYFALPYNDFSGGHRRAGASQVVYWAGEKAWSDTESMCKNRWLRIVHGSLTAYAQWEDVGPFLVNDSLYVFRESRPRNSENDSAGLDVSPAVHDYLGLTGLDKVDWQFVPFDSVPDGSWKQVITVRQISWERRATEQRAGTEMVSQVR